MKKWVGIVVVLSFTSSLAWAGEQTFKGIPMKTTQTEFLKVFKNFKCDAPKEEMTLCTSSKDTYGELPVDRIEAQFWKGKLVNIAATRINPTPEDADSYYAQWKGKLSLKFGIPTINNKKDWKTFIVVSTWESKTRDIVLAQVNETGLDIMKNELHTIV